MSFFKNIFSSDKKATLDKGLEKSSSTFFDKLSKAVVGKSKVDADVLDNLEEVLVTSDVGVNTTLKVIDRIEARVAKARWSTDSAAELRRSTSTVTGSMRIVSASFNNLGIDKLPN